METVYLFGDNEDNRKIYDGKGEREGIVIDVTSKQEVEKQAEKIVRLAKTEQQRHIVVVNTKKEEDNIAVCKAFVKRMEKANDKEKEIFFQTLRISVFGDAKRQTAFEKLVGKGYGCIAYVDKHQQIAMDFIERYPFAKFLNEKQLDYQTSLLRKGVGINAFILGFGRTNQQILLSSIANNQFLCEGENEPSLKQVNYYIFDKNTNVDLPHHRYAKEVCSYNKEEYLPLPSLPANEQYFSFSASDKETLEKIKALTGNEADINFLIVDYGSDEENISLAKTLLQKREEWKKENIIIFVNSKEILQEESGIAAKNCFFIGNERKCVFNVEEILGDRIYRLAQLRNGIYDLEYALTSGQSQIGEEDIQKNKENALRNWYIAKSQLDRDSSVYGCLSLRSKLNLMGLDYCRKEENNLPALTEEEYFSCYAKGDMPNYRMDALKADGKPIVCYTIHFPDSRRKTMAIHEHYRWNAFMLSKGMTPATKKQILEEWAEKNGKLCYTNGKNYEEGRHGNLTTFAGLIEFRQMVAKRDGCEDAEKDVIKYDYQLLDDAYWLLEKSGCKIIKKKG